MSWLVLCLHVHAVLRNVRESSRDQVTVMRCWTMVDFAWPVLAARPFPCRISDAAILQFRNTHRAIHTIDLSGCVLITDFTLR